MKKNFLLIGSMVFFLSNTVFAGPKFLSKTPNPRDDKKPREIIDIPASNEPTVNIAYVAVIRNSTAIPLDYLTFVCRAHFGFDQEGVSYEGHEIATVAGFKSGNAYVYRKLASSQDDYGNKEILYLVKCKNDQSFTSP